LEFQCGEKTFNATVCKNKHFYELLVSDKARVSSGFAKMKEDFGLLDSAVTKAFINVKTVYPKCLSEASNSRFFKNNFHNSRLAEIGYVQDGSCTFFFRVSSETVNYLFYECLHTNQFWKDFKNVFGLHFLVNRLNFPCRIL